MKDSVRQKLSDASLILLAALSFANVVVPIRNRGKQVGRNSDCPCGSGKKFKHCHMVKTAPSVVIPIDNQ